MNISMIIHIHSFFLSMHFVHICLVCAAYETFRNPSAITWILAIRRAVRCILHVLHAQSVHVVWIHFFCVPAQRLENNIFYIGIESANCDRMQRSLPTVCDRYMVFSEITRWDKVTEPTKPWPCTTASASAIRTHRNTYAKTNKKRHTLQHTKCCTE